MKKVTKKIETITLYNPRGGKPQKMDIEIKEVEDTTPKHVNVKIKSISNTKPKKRKK